ncbi:hypothetical protein VTK56DRAFT_6127 [Thermocarpiscus australiensis]
MLFCPFVLRRAFHDNSFPGSLSPWLHIMWLTHYPWRLIQPTEAEWPVDTFSQQQELPPLATDTSNRSWGVVRGVRMEWPGKSRAVRFAASTPCCKALLLHQRQADNIVRRLYFLSVMVEVKSG